MAFAHEFGENVRGRALFAVHAHEKRENVREVAFLGKMAHEFGENVRERRLKGRVTSKMGGFVVGREVGSGAGGMIFRANRLDIKNF